MLKLHCLYMSSEVGRFQVANECEIKIKLKSKHVFDGHCLYRGKEKYLKILQIETAAHRNILLLQC